MDKLPKKIVRFDTLRIERGIAKFCVCRDPHYEIDEENRIVRCMDCGAIVDPLVALLQIAKDVEKWSNYTEQLLEQRRQIANYQPRQVVIKELEKWYVGAERDHTEPTCPRCGEPFALQELLSVPWCNPIFLKKEASRRTATHI